MDVSARYQDWLKAAGHSPYLCRQRVAGAGCHEGCTVSGRKTDRLAPTTRQSGSLPGCLFWAILLCMTHALKSWSVLNVCVCVWRMQIMFALDSRIVEERS